MKNYLLPLLLVLTIIPQVANARKDNNLEKADYLYNHFAYHQAIYYYQKVLPNNNDPIILGKIGDCYRLTNQPEKATEWYAKAVILNGCPDNTKLHYGEALMTQQKYDAAKKWISDYLYTHKDDIRAQNLVKSCDMAASMNDIVPNATIALLPFNTDGSDIGPALHNNELYFTADTAIHTRNKTDPWTGNNFYKIYHVSCDANGNCSPVISDLNKKINSKYHDGPCTFSADGNEMYFTRTFYIQKLLTKTPLPDENDVVHLEIQIASDYDATKKEYKKITSFPYNNKNYSVAHPAISKDGHMLIFASDMNGGQGGTDLYLCTRNNGNQWSIPQNLGKAVNTEGNELFPYLAADNTLYFSSNGHIGYGGFDIYACTWDSQNNSFSEPRNVGVPINSSYDDISFVLQDNGNQGYFASNRPASKGSDNIYSFNKLQIYLSLTVIDSFNKTKIAGSTISLNCMSNTQSFTTGEEGILFTQLYPRRTCVATVSKIGYKSKDIDISTLNFLRSDTIRKTVALAPDFNIVYNAVVLDQSTKQPIEDATIVFYHHDLAKADTMDLKAGEHFIHELKPGKIYGIYALKDNYYGYEKVVSTKDIKPRAGAIRIVDTLYMKKLQVGETYRIDNIYYDFNKANIREDAKPALDRLIEVLNKYPKMHIQINSHTDCRGSNTYNNNLSNARARSVIIYLQQRGISNTRLKSRGYGKTIPIEKCKCDKCSEEQHQMNRRTEFQITAMD